MNKRSRSSLLWGPRILAILVCLFLGLFALDAFGNGKTLSEALPDFAVHVAPVLVLLAVVGVSWRWEWVGGLVFTSVAAVYAYFARDHVSWVLCISAPLLIVGVLYLWSWRRHGSLRAEA
jgi:glucose-6-phosphate-specific signal transduction histidine kinase